MTGHSIIFESLVTLAATGIWNPFGPLLSVIPTAAGIQSPVPIQPGSCLQEYSSWDVNQSTRSVLFDITVLVHKQGSGFPLRRE